MHARIPQRERNNARYYGDDANRLRYVDYDWTTTEDVHYVYDPTGQRVEIRYGQIARDGDTFTSFTPAAGQARAFVCLEGQVLEEWSVTDGATGSHTDDTVNTLTYRYVRNAATDLGGGIGSIAYQIEGSDYRYYHYNHKGDVHALTDDSKNIIAWYEYDAWGAPVTVWEASGVENEFRFSTKQWDEVPDDGSGNRPADLGLIYFGARYYDPELGRWTQLDPAGTIDGLNMYVYLQDAPLMLVDSHGLGGTLVIDDSCEGRDELLRDSEYAYGDEDWDWSNGAKKEELQKSDFMPLPTRVGSHNADLLWYPRLSKGKVVKITDIGSCTIRCKCKDRSAPEKQQVWYVTHKCTVFPTTQLWAYTDDAKLRDRTEQTQHEAAWKKVQEGASGPVRD